MIQRGDIDCSLDEPRVKAVLDRLHREAQIPRIRFFRRRIPGALDILLSRKPSVAEVSHRHADLYLAISREQGIFAYLVGRSICAHRIVEFGTSFGVSAIYLAAAVRDNGGGLVIGSEIVEGKALTAQSNLEEAGLADYVDIRVGDAQQTLVDPGGVVDMVLLDGWKKLYLPIIRMLTPHLRPGAVILGDNILHFERALAPYVAYMRDARNGFQSVTLPFRGGFEYSVRLDNGVA
jgi:predicted O-methyltransferase YrrM